MSLRQFARRPRPSLSSHPPQGLLLAALLATALLAGSCDVMPGANSEDDASEPPPDSMQISLLESGQMVTGMSDVEPLRIRTVNPGKKNSGSASFDATHACTMTLYRSDGPRGAGYYVRSAEITYPDSVLARADGKTSLLTARIRLQDVPDPSRINAQLRCRLPAVDGAERRVQRFFRFGPEQLEASGFAPSDSTTDSTGAESIPRLASTPTPKELECDEVRFCQGGECLTYEGTSCFGGGGGGGRSGGVGGLPPRNSPCSGEPCPFIYPDDMEGGPTGGPSTGPPSPQPGDYVADPDTFDITEDEPDCSASNSKEWKKLYCDSNPPEGERKSKTKNALDRIASRGGVCEKIASYGRKMMKAGALRYYPDGPGRPGGVGATGLVLLHEYWVEQTPTEPVTEELPNGDKLKRNLDFMLVHEIDHGRIEKEDIHSNYGYSTPNTDKCSGLN